MPGARQQPPKKETHQQPRKKQAPPKPSPPIKPQRPAHRHRPGVGSGVGASGLVGEARPPFHAEAAAVELLGPVGVLDDDTCTVGAHPPQTTVLALISPPSLVTTRDAATSDAASASGCGPARQQDQVETAPVQHRHRARDTRCAEEVVGPLEVGESTRKPTASSGFLIRPPARPRAPRSPHEESAGA
jgi:hypothetical protein